MLDRLQNYLAKFLSPGPVVNRNMLTFYDPIETSGSNEPSIAFFLLNGHRIGRINTAEMVTDSPSSKYELSLIDDAKQRIALRGCSAGYSGHGPSGTLTVLRLAGFPEGKVLDSTFRSTELEDLVHTKNNFTLHKG